jgi:hypothetical protein
MIERPSRTAQLILSYSFGSVATQRRAKVPVRARAIQPAPG